MSDYTPTTSDVRVYFNLAMERLGIDDAAFDRWLKKNNARVFEEGQVSVMEMEPSGEGLYHPDNPYGSPYDNVSGTPKEEA